MEENNPTAHLKKNHHFVPHHKHGKPVGQVDETHDLVHVRDGSEADKGEEQNKSGLIGKVKEVLSGLIGKVKKVFKV
jgi:hypothetical protein